MMTYPILFRAQSRSAPGINSVWKTESQGVETECAIPPEFDGPGGGISPEDLYAQALTNCFVATFKVYVEKSKLSFGDLDVQTELQVDLGESGQPVMKACLFRVKISGCEKPDRIKLLANKAFSSGFILNSVKTDLSLESTVE